MRGDANLRVRKVADYNIESASGSLREGRVTETELFEQKSVVAEQISGYSGICEGCDRVGLGISMVKPSRNLAQVRRWVVRTALPMTRTGFLSFLGLNRGSRSTERTGHRYKL